MVYLADEETHKALIDMNKKVLKKKKSEQDSEYFNPKDLSFEFDISKADYKVDVLQNELLKFYLRADPRFRRAFHQNFTNQFIQFIKDKAKLNEPISISITGVTRGGKSSSAISICILHQAIYGRKFSIDYVCGNAMEFLEKLKSFPEDKLKDRIFLIDEEKMTMFSVGSVAKKMKLADVQNIIAVNNISTISINPVRFANEDSHYGLKIFGKCFDTKTCRLMLYNLQEKGRGGTLPLGNIYMPIFNVLVPKDYAEPLDKSYREKKQAWVNMEMRGEGDTLASLRKRLAQKFVNDSNYKQITKMNEKITYITATLGSEWTQGECKDIFQLTKLYEKGLLSSDEEI